jgi:hypothetical protein
MLSDVRAFWPRLVPAVRHYLNTLRRKLLKGCAPLELAFGIKVEPPLTFAIKTTRKLKEALFAFNYMPRPQWASAGNYSGRAVREAKASDARTTAARYVGREAR